jgi:ATP-dependent protease ClpP protease subunit
MAETEANVVTCADGLVASAGSLIFFAGFFAGQAMKIGEFCEVMLHDGSSGELGKINENLKSAEFTSRRISHIYHTIYGRFFSKDQVDSVLDGKDLYLNGEEVEQLIEKAIEEQGADDDTTGS